MKLADLHDAFAKSRTFGFFEDFDHFVTGDRFTSIAADGGASLAVNDGVRGVATLTTGAVDNNEVYLHTTRELFLVANNKPCVAEARLQYAEANTDDANVLFGFMDAAAANALVDNGAGPKTSGTHAVIYKVDGGTRWQVQTSLSTTQTSVDLTAANSLDKIAKTAGGAAYQVLRVEIEPYSATNALVKFFIDGVHVYTQDWVYTSATDMDVVVGVKDGGGTGEVVLVDYIGAYQVR